MIKNIFFVIYLMGLLLFIGASLVSKLSKGGVLTRVLMILSTLLMTAWASYDFISLIKTGVAPTFFCIFYTIIVTLNIVFSAALLILAIFGELDPCSESETSSKPD